MTPNLITQGMQVYSHDGALLGSVEEIWISPDGNRAYLRLLNGALSVSNDDFASIKADSIWLKQRATEISLDQSSKVPDGYTRSTTLETPLDKLGVGGSATLPRYEEELVVDKEWQQYGTVRINKSVVEEPETVDVDLQAEEYEVERIPVNREWTPADDHPRIENDVIVVPVVREQLEITKRRVVTEEVRLTRRLVSQHQQVTDTVRKEIVNIEEASTEPGIEAGQ